MNNNESPWKIIEITTPIKTWFLVAQRNNEVTFPVLAMRNKHYAHKWLNHEGDELFFSPTHYMEIPELE